MTKQLITAAFLGCLAWGASSTPASADGIYVDVDIAPPHIEEYPRTVYEGEPVYYYEGHWYARRGPRWVYYREEPRPLVVYRESPHYRRHYVAAPRPRHERRYEERRYEDNRREERRHEEHHHHHHRD